MAAICRVEPIYFDSILDCGATANIFPDHLEHEVSNIQYEEGTLSLGDKHETPTYATCTYGMLEHVILCHDIAHPLISVGYLTKVLKLFVFYSNRTAYILKRTKRSNMNPLNSFTILTTAEMERDGLFHVQDNTKFLNKSYIRNTDNLDLNSVLNLDSRLDIPTPTPKINFTISDQLYTSKEIKFGGAKVFVKSSKQYLTQLQWLHVRLGHLNESQLKRMVQRDSLLGTGVSWSEIKNLQLGPCDTCLKAKMKAFPLSQHLAYTVRGVRVSDKRL